MIKLVRRGAIAGAVAGLAIGLWKFLAAQRPDAAGVRYEPQPFPMPPRPVPAALSHPSVEPDENGNCPVSHPIKGKHTSGIYHQPGGFSYDRTRADRCYLDAGAAERDGLRAAKR